MQLHQTPIELVRVELSLSMHQTTYFELACYLQAAFVVNEVGEHVLDLIETAKCF